LPPYLEKASKVFRVVLIGILSRTSEFKVQFKSMYLNFGHMNRLNAISGQKHNFGGVHGQISSASLRKFFVFDSLSVQFGVGKWFLADRAVQGYGFLSFKTSFWRIRPYIKAGYAKYSGLNILPYLEAEAIYGDEIVRTFIDLNAANYYFGLGQIPIELFTGISLNNFSFWDLRILWGIGIYVETLPKSQPVENLYGKIKNIFYKIIELTGPISLRVKFYSNI